MMKKQNVLVLFALMFLLFGCRTEDFYSENGGSFSRPLTGNYKLKEAPLFKQFLTSNVISKSSGISKANFQLDDNQTIFIVYKENSTSYSMKVNNQDNSYNVLVYTITGGKESFYTAEYIPKSNIIDMGINHFTGKVNYKSIEGTLLGTINFIHGDPKNKSTMETTNPQEKASRCTSNVLSIPIPCTSPEHHMPWETCYETGSDRPYYQTTIIKTCIELSYPDVGLDGGGGYGGSGESTPDITIEDAFNVQLAKASFPALSIDEYAYIQNNAYVGGQLFGYFGLDLTDFNNQFLHWCINYLMTNNNFNLSNAMRLRK